MKIEVRPHKKARIEIIPLIDVIFFCLATFVLVTLSMNRNLNLDVQLPQAQPPRDVKPDPALEPVMVSVTELGDIFWNSDVLTPEQYRVRLADFRRENPDPKIIVNGESRARFGDAVRLMDQARAAGIEKVTLVTQLRRIPRG